MVDMSVKFAGIGAKLVILECCRCNYSTARFTKYSGGETFMTEDSLQVKYQTARRN